MPQEMPKDADTAWIQHMSIQHEMPLRLDELDFAKELSCIDGKRAGGMVQRAGTYKELVLEDTLVQDRHSYDDGLAGLLAGGVC
jgi:hypothetical protein